MLPKQNFHEYIIKGKWVLGEERAMGIEMILGKGFYTLSLTVRKMLRQSWQKHAGGVTIIYIVSLVKQQIFHQVTEMNVYFGIRPS